MKQNDRKIYILMSGLLILILVGFYFTLNKLNALDTAFKNLQSQNQLNSQSNNPPSATTTPAQTNQSVPTVNNQNTTDVPTSIIFNASSSPLLTPQTNLTVTVADVAEAKDGTITVNIKVFSNEASSYSAIDISGLFQLIDLNGTNQNPLSVTGSFNSIPPQNAVTGSLTFKTDPQNKTIILQVGAGDQIKFYQFDFNNQTYKETILG